MINRNYIELRPADGQTDVLLPGYGRAAHPIQVYSTRLWESFDAGQGVIRLRYPGRARVRVNGVSHMGKNYGVGETDHGITIKTNKEGLALLVDKELILRVNVPNWAQWDTPLKPIKGWKVYLFSNTGN